MSKQKFLLPAHNDGSNEFSTDNNSVVIIGANGSGKSRLGVWIEEQNIDKVHRIAAQRSLNFKKFVTVKTIEEAENLLQYGHEEKADNKSRRWGHDQTPALTLLTDYDHLLSAVFAKFNEENADYVEKCKEKECLGYEKPTTPERITERIIRIWNVIFSHMQLSFKDGRVKSKKILKNDMLIEYDALNMSDGERVALYLIAQALCVPTGKTIIIDEPELHLHRSIMNKLWSEIERERTDCLFIYITHDIQFATAHKMAKKIWVQNYDGENWTYHEIANSELPEELFLDILGNRKPVIFVEGTRDSYDTALYSEIYKEYHIIPSGGCLSVISNVKAFKSCTDLHHLKCFGIIDRDFRTDHEINSFKEKSIHVLEVSEVENLFLVEEILKCMNTSLAKPDETAISKTINHIKKRYSEQIEGIIADAIKAEIKHQVNSFDFTSTNAEKIAEAFSEKIISSFEKIKKEISEKLHTIRNAADYRDILRVFNQKSLASSIGQHFGLRNNGYCEQVLNYMRGKDRECFVNALQPYLPADIPITCVEMNEPQPKSGANIVPFNG